MAFTPFPPRQPSSSARLPLTLMTLDDWALATITGPDGEKYLQGQITADVSHLTDEQHLLAAHCDAKGKMWSNLRVFRRNEGFAWIERRSLRDAQLTELKKYAVFSKVTIAADDESVLLGVAGFQARAALTPLFNELPNADKQVVSEGATSVLWFEHPAERFLLVTDVATATRITDALRGEAQLNNSQQWLALNIEAGLPVIDSANSAQFIPQATNLQALGGIGSQTGLAAINLQMTDDGNQIKNKDADLLLIGAIPSSLKDDTKINLLVEATKSWVKMPMRHYDLASIYPDDEARTPNTRTDITSSGPMAAVIGFQSPYNDQRSVVALLADSPRGNELLTNALNDSGKRAAMFGSVAVIRESGVNSLRVGDVYYVGHLPWFERIWFALSNHPILLAIFAAVSIVLLAWVLWRMLRIISRRRLSLDDE